MNMKKWLDAYLRSPKKKSMPVLSFPSVSLMGITVKELINSSDNQAKGMKLIADRVPSAASVSMMDLSVEAECFGANVVFSDGEIPTVVGSTVGSLLDAQALAVPEVGAKRTGIYIEGIKKAKALITDRPVFAGVIGSFSLAGRLVGVTDAMIDCYDEPEMMHAVLEKATDFLVKYVQAYKQVGANGVVIAEPLTGLLSPALASEFSEPYIRRIVEACQDDNFIVIYHNCGNTTIQIIDSILATGAAAYHFGNAIDMAEMMKHIPSGTVAMGNIDPAGQFMNGTVQSIGKATLELLEKCSKYPNFAISSGCDIPPAAKWENIDAYFAAIDEFYSKQ